MAMTVMINISRKRAACWVSHGVVSSTHCQIFLIGHGSKLPSFAIK